MTICTKLYIVERIMPCSIKICTQPDETSQLKNSILAQDFIKTLRDS